MAGFIPYLNINTKLTPNPVAGNPSKAVLLIGQRITNGELILSTNGFPQPNYYVPILLPSFSNGTEALQYLTNYGIKWQLGFNFNLILPEPTTVTNIAGNTVLTWASIPYRFASLTNFVLSGTLTQGSVSGSAKLAQIISGVATLTISGIVAYTTDGGDMSLAGVDNIAYPDPDNSDPIALMVWDFYQTNLSAFSSAQGSPFAYISILQDRDASISATATSIALQDPDDVTVNSDASVELIYTYTDTADLTNFGYLPTTTLGNSIITQAVSTATGVYAGYTIVPSNTGGTVTILITGVTGIFNTTNVLSLVLDSSINAGEYLDNIDLYGAVMQFPVNNMSSITTTHADFYNMVATLNLPNQVLNNHYFTYAGAGNITSLPVNAVNLPSPNTQQDILVTYPYVAKFGDIPYDNIAGNVASGRAMSAVMYLLANGDAPFPPLMLSTIKHLPVSSVASTTSYSVKQNGSGEIAVIQGWLPLVPNTQGVVQLLQSNTTLITIPNTTTPDTEFRYTHIWDSIRWVKYNVAQLFNTIKVLPNNQGSQLISPQFKDQFRNGIIAILFNGQTLGILQNVDAYQIDVLVIQDTILATQVDAYIPSQIIPQLNGADVNINVFSSLITFNNATA